VKISEIPCVHRVSLLNPTKDVVRVTYLHSNPSYVLDHVRGGDNNQPVNIEIVTAWKPGETIEVPDFVGRAIHGVRDGVLRSGLAPQLRVVARDGVPCEEPFKRPIPPEDTPTLLRAQAARRIED
jgi:hypothetical protein